MAAEFFEEPHFFIVQSVLEEEEKLLIMDDVLGIGSLLEEVEEGFDESLETCDLVMHFRFNFFLFLAFKSSELLDFRREL